MRCGVLSHRLRQLTASKHIHPPTYINIRHQSLSSVYLQVEREFYRYTVTCFPVKRPPVKCPHLLIHQVKSPLGHMSPSGQTPLTVSEKDAVSHVIDMTRYCIDINTVIRPRLRHSALETLKHP